jgi:hypothetical protein
MCRDNNESGRRCPCDTSEARQLRRKNAAARSSHSVLVQEKVEPNFLPEPVKVEPYTVQSVKEGINSLNTLGDELRESRASSAEVMVAYDKRLNEIGAGVEYLAETKYGAPTDDEIREGVKNAEENALIEKARMRKELEDKQAEQALIQEKLHVHADRNTHPIMRERHAVWAEKDPETYAAYKAIDDESVVLSRAIFGNTGNAILEAKKALYEKRNVAIQEALKEVGVVFADPETIEYADDSHNDAVKSLKNALPFYPQSWVDASNAAHQKRPLRVKRSKGRAHYSSMKAQRKYTHRTDAFVIRKPKDWQPDPHDRSESHYLSMNGEESWTDPLSGIVHESYSMYGDKEEKTNWVCMSYEYYRGTGTPPKSGNWEKVEHYEEKYVSGEGMVRTGNMETRYRKPKTTRSRESSTYTAELTVTKDGQVFVGEDKGMRVAMHEFAHRVEATTPHVTAYEDAFLKRRAGHLPVQDGSEVTPEKISSIYSGKKEVGFKDNFPSHYMGKVYHGSSYKEILSMGMESVFSGTNGGLVGLDNYSADADYKKFILGVLASSAKK